MNALPSEIPQLSQDAEHLSFGPIDDRSPQEDAKKASVVINIGA